MQNAMAVELTKNQKEIIDFSGEELLIRGIAGSGKTLVLLFKAKKLAEEEPDAKVGIFTYNKALSNASDLILKEENFTNIKIQTFHSWAYFAFEKITGTKCDITNKSRTHLEVAIKNVSQNNSHRFVTDEKYFDFLADEISWIKGRGITSFEEYLDVERKGRGSEVRVTRQDRIVIYDIYEAYQTSKKFQLDYDDLGYILSKYIDRFPQDLKFDYVFVDEAQDLNMVQLKCLKALAKKVFVVAADKGQKIYKTSFSWRDIGINISGGRTKTLQDSFRSTKQIIQLAKSLQQNDRIVSDEDFIQSNIPTREGVLPVIIHREKRAEQDQILLADVVQSLKEVKEATIGILAPTWYSLQRIQRGLYKKGYTSELIKKDKGNPITPGVKLTTFHSAKGLEFDYIFLMDLTDENVTMDSELDMNEFWDNKRRLWYVAMTRAKHALRIYSYGNDVPHLVQEMDSSLYLKG